MLLVVLELLSPVLVKVSDDGSALIQALGGRGCTMSVICTFLERDPMLKVMYPTCFPSESPTVDTLILAYWVVPLLSSPPGMPVLIHCVPLSVNIEEDHVTVLHQLPIVTVCGLGSPRS